MNGIHIPTAQDILDGGGFIPLKDFLKNPVSQGQEDIASILAFAREKLQRQRELKRRLDGIVEQVLG